MTKYGNLSEQLQDRDFKDGKITISGIWLIQFDPGEQTNKCRNSKKIFVNDCI